MLDYGFGTRGIEYDKRQCHWMIVLFAYMQNSIILLLNRTINIELCICVNNLFL